VAGLCLGMSAPAYADAVTVWNEITTTKPFALNRTSQFRPEPPPPLQSERYRRDYDEVKAYGARSNSKRTAEQTDVAYFWSDNVVTQWNHALRALADARMTSLGDSAGPVPPRVCLAGRRGTARTEPCGEGPAHGVSSRA
jgi:hypothetical protein